MKYSKDNKQFEPLFSIIIPSYNQGDFIEKTIKSILSQDYKNKEIIVIDGGSKDTTVSILKKYNDQLAFWVSEKDEGQTAAIIKGFEIARGDILYWINSDDELFEKNTLCKVATAFSKGNVDVVYGNMVIIDHNGAEIGKRFVTKIPKTYRKLLFTKGKIGLYQPSTFWTRDIYVKSKGLNPAYRFCMDNDLFIKMVLSNARLFYIDDFLSKFRVHTSSKSSTLQGIAENEKEKITNNYKIDVPKLEEILSVLFLKLYKAIHFIMKRRLLIVLKYRLTDPLKWLP